MKQKLGVIQHLTASELKALDREFAGIAFPNETSDGFESGLISKEDKEDCAAGYHRSAR